jgi:hypothetical protein
MKKNPGIKTSVPAAVAALLSILLVCAAGCETKSRAQFQAQQAFVAGQQQALEQSRPKPPVVTFTGPVRHFIVPWTEDLTLATAFLAAEYTGYLGPRLIRVTRGRETITVKPGDLLQGQDMPLQASDIVEVVP